MDLAAVRQATYRLFAHSLLYPDGERLRALAAAARELEHADPVWEAFAFHSDWCSFLHCLEELPLRDLPALQNEYVTNFLARTGELPCPIWESAYLAGDPSAAGLVLAQLEREYAQAGLAPSPSLRAGPDHAAVELEFMSFLCGQEVGAWNKRDAGQALLLCRGQRAFLRHHLQGWFPQLSRRVACAMAASAYAPVTRAATAFVVHDSDLLDALVDLLESPGDAG